MINKTHSLLLVVSFLIAGCNQSEEVQSWNVETAVNRDIVVTVQAAGIIEPVTTVELKSKASGEILEIKADTGDEIQAGALLVQIDKRIPSNSLAQATAEREAALARRNIAESQRKRAEKLFSSGTLNEVEYEDSILEFANAKAEFVRAELAVENARIALDDTEVRAPIHGTLIQRDVEKGQVISSPTQDVGGGTVLLKMANLRFVQVRSLIDETDIGKISPGQQALVTVAAYPNQPFIGEVRKVEPQAEDEESVTLFAAIVTIDNNAGLLRPGMNAEVTVAVASHYDVLAIPTIALRILAAEDIEAAALFSGVEEDQIYEQLGINGAGSKSVNPSDELQNDTKTKVSAANDSMGGEYGYEFGGKYWVFVVKDEALSARPVQTGLTDLDYSEIIHGVSEGEDILLLPSTQLILSNDRFRKWMGDMVGVPGMKSEAR